MEDVMDKTKDKPNEKQKNQVALWILRVLLDLKRWTQLFDRHSSLLYGTEEILPFIGFGQFNNIEEISKKQLYRVLRNKKNIVETKPAELNQNLISNTGKLAKYIGLDETEEAILMFLAMLYENKGLQIASEYLGEMSFEDNITVLSVILDIPQKKISKALSRSGLLIRSGLLDINRSNHKTGLPTGIDDRMGLLEGLADLLQESETTIESMLTNYFVQTEQSELTEKNYSHVADHFNLIQNHIQQPNNLQNKKSKGINILVYGPPGTGKTEFAKTIVKKINYTLYEISITNNDTLLNEESRLRAFQLAQQVLIRQKNILLLFDEIDSLLEQHISFLNFNSVNLKALINKNLENNPVPTIWIANDIGLADNAFIRRFDIVLKMDHPPRTTRLEIISKSLQGIPVSQEWLELLADNKNIAPAVMTKAANVIRYQKLENPKEIEGKLEKLMESTLTAMGYSQKPLINNRSKITYRLDVVNSDHNLEKLIQGLKEQKEGRLCLYGPPGTGKTEFGHYLSRQLNSPLILKRGSDLLNAFVGQTEANIAQMFMEATHEKAVLLLDEADSFLQDRKKSKHSWEITQVNELLTQMENYNGIFICSTNLMNNIDTASLRRFDMKIKFDFMKKEQTWMLFQSLFKEKNIACQHKQYWKNKLAQYSNLTHGDFTTVIRKCRISGEKLDPEYLLNGLIEEIGFKDFKSKQQVGFV